MDLDELDDLAGQWHCFSNQPVSALRTEFTDERVKLTKTVVERFLGKSDDLVFHSADEFAKFVTDLRDSERKWSRQLGKLLIDVEELVAAGDRVSAQVLFDTFETECPWISFVLIARAQKHGLL